MQQQQEQTSVKNYNIIVEFANFLRENGKNKNRIKLINSFRDY